MQLKIDFISESSRATADHLITQYLQPPPDAPALLRKFFGAWAVKLAKLSSHFEAMGAQTGLLEG
jgi:hypothetical protein